MLEFWFWCFFCVWLCVDVVVLVLRGEVCGGVCV